MDLKLFGSVRKLLGGVDQVGPGGQLELALNEQGELLTAPGSSSYEETVRAGRAYHVCTAAAIAAVVAVPTTAVMLGLYNNEPDDGKIYVIDRAWALNVVSTAVASQAVLLGLVGQVREAAPTDAVLAINPLNGMGGRDTRARTILNATALPATTGLAANWRPLGTGLKTGAAATPGYGIVAPVDGRMIIPPGRYGALHVLANVIGETFIVGFEWHEKNAKVA